jgi:hypothetical protein
MRKLRVFESISVDGYFTDANGDISWAHAGREDAEFADWVGGNASSGGELLFGRKTYQMMEAFWPTPMAIKQMPEVAKGMNTVKKYVACMTIQPAWSNTQPWKGDLLKGGRPQRPGPDGVPRQPACLWCAASRSGQSRSQKRRVLLEVSIVSNGGMARSMSPCQSTSVRRYRQFVARRWLGRGRLRVRWR